MVANLRSTCAAWALLAGLIACGGTDAQESGGASDTGSSGVDAGNGNDAGNGGDAGSDAGTGDADSGVPAVFDKFQGSATYQSTVTVSLSSDGNSVVVDSNAVPNHKSPYFGSGDSRHEADTNAGFNQNPNSIVAQSLVFKIPLHPSPAATPSQTPLGPIGVSLNGVPFFNQYAAGRQVLTTEIVSFDQYGGHPQQQGQYHYHVEPVGLTGAPNNLGKSALLGFLLDGYPVYGPVEDGVTLKSSDLDAYHGHTKATADYPSGVYHYHVTADAPYINGDGFYGTPGTVSQ